MMKILIGDRLVGDEEPVFIIAEIGINHNGDLAIAKKLIDIAADAGCDAVKFQKRTPHLCVPPEQMGELRQTPWGEMSYLQYKYKVEFEREEFDEIDRYCKEVGIIWFASCWDSESVDFMDKYSPPCYKIASASLTDDRLIQHTVQKGKPLIASCGMSTIGDIEGYLKLVDKKQQVLLHSNSSYPARTEDLNLRVIPSLKEKYDILVGYSGHEIGLFTTLLSIPLGACCIERHITLDRDMWGTDHAASVEPKGLYKLVEEVRDAELALGSSEKIVHPSEKSVRKKLRRKNIQRPEGKTAVIVQARMASHRLPGKMLEDLSGRPLVYRLLERALRVSLADQVILAIPDSSENDVFLSIAKDLGVDIFRGSEDDVMDRYLKAAEAFSVDYIVRLPGDNPCLSPKEIDKLIGFFHLSAFDFCSNLYEIKGSGYPDGIGAEIFSTEMLRLVHQKARHSEEREHVHRYFYEHLNVGTLMCHPDFAYPALKLDVNTQEELDYIRKVYTGLIQEKNDFDIMDIISWHKTNCPEKLGTPTCREFYRDRPNSRTLD